MQVREVSKDALPALAHAGWRGAAAGVLEQGLEVLGERVGTDAARVHLYLGPAICGRCYDLGPEVFEAVWQPVPARPVPIDLRAVLAPRAIDVGVPRGRITVCEHCARCTGGGLFSRSGSDRERRVAYIGIRA